MPYRFAKYRRLFPLLLLIFIDEMGNALFFPILPPILFDPIQGILHHGVTLAVRQFDYGLTLAIFPLMMLLSAPILGDLSDHFGRKKVLIFSLLGTVFGYLLSGYAVANESVSLLVIGRALDGLTAGNFSIAQAAVIDLSTPEEKTANLALTVFAISIGFIVGPLLAVFLTNTQISVWFNLSTPLYAASLLGLINTIWIYFAFQESFEAPKERLVLNVYKAIHLFTDAFRVETLRFLSYILLFLLLGWGAYIQYASIFAYREFAFTNDQIAWFMVVMALSFTFASTVLIKILVKYFSNRSIVFLSSIASVIGVLITAIAFQAWMVWIGIIPIAIGIALTHAALMAMYSNQVDSTKQGWIMGVASAVISVAILLSAIADGVLGNIAVRMPIWLAFICYGLCAVLSGILVLRRKKEA